MPRGRGAKERSTARTVRKVPASNAAPQDPQLQTRRRTREAAHLASEKVQEAEEVVEPVKKKRKMSKRNTAPKKPSKKIKPEPPASHQAQRAPLATPRKLHLSDLPHHILQKILFQVSPDDISCFIRTCKVSRHFGDLFQLVTNHDKSLFFFNSLMPRRHVKDFHPHSSGQHVILFELCTEPENASNTFIKRFSHLPSFIATEATEGKPNNVISLIIPKCTHANSVIIGSSITLGALTLDRGPLLKSPGPLLNIDCEEEPNCLAGLTIDAPSRTSIINVCQLSHSKLDSEHLSVVFKDNDIDVPKRGINAIDAPNLKSLEITWTQSPPHLVRLNCPNLEIIKATNKYRRLYEHWSNFFTQLHGLSKTSPKFKALHFNSGHCDLLRQVPISRNESILEFLEELLIVLSDGTDGKRGRRKTKAPKRSFLPMPNLKTLIITGSESSTKEVPNYIYAPNLQNVSLLLSHHMSEPEIGAFLSSVPSTLVKMTISFSSVQASHERLFNPTILPWQIGRFSLTLRSIVLNSFKLDAFAFPGLHFPCLEDLILDNGIFTQGAPDFILSITAPRLQSLSIALLEPTRRLHIVNIPSLQQLTLLKGCKYDEVITVNLPSLCSYVSRSEVSVFRGDNLVALRELRFVDRVTMRVEVSQVKSASEANAIRELREALIMPAIEFQRVNPGLMISPVPKEVLENEVYP